MLLPSLLALFLLIVGCSSEKQSVPAENSPIKLLIVIDYPDHTHHQNYAMMTKRFLHMEASSLRQELIVEVLLTRETWPDLKGTYTYFPVIKELLEVFSKDNFQWVLFINEYTEVNLRNLLIVIKNLKPSEPHFIGRALVDQQYSIIHHYDPPGLEYPDPAAGFLVSWYLISQKRKLNPQTPRIDFTIDPKYEIASYFNGGQLPIQLSGNPYFCSNNMTDKKKCLTSYSIESTLCPSSSTHKAVKLDDIFVLVKTGEVFHKTRVPLQQELWTRKVKNLEICSEKADPSIPTVSVDAPNTKQGHCAKFLAILRRAYKEEHINKRKWVVVVDDDTIMNIDRLPKLLSCYADDIPVAIGERYGYGIAKSEGRRGYDYITGGGGTVLNMAAIRKLMTAGVECDADDAPDDMTLGMWLKMLDIPIVHSPLFHQTTPSSYANGYLEPQKGFIISFHKFNQEDPKSIAQEWLGLSVEKASVHVHTEL